MTVFIDGNSGTTGLKIVSRLGARPDIDLIILDDSVRKDPKARKEALNSCDAAFLCLPDAASREAMAMIENPAVTVIDTSTAHRTDPAWAYGFPELSTAHRDTIKTSRRIAVPGCHASGFIALVYPLVAAGALPKDALLTCHSLTGYSGGGKAMIANYEGDGADRLLAPRQYALSQSHKHLPEMAAVPGLVNSPVFCPIVSNYFSGMEVSVPLFKSQLTPGYSSADLKKIFSDKYTGPVVTFGESISENGFIGADALSGSDNMEITVEGNDERILLIARFDNLGKGASGAAIQCLNISVGADETTGLVL